MVLIYYTPFLRKLPRVRLKISAGYCPAPAPAPAHSNTQPKWSRSVLIYEYSQTRLI